MTEQHIGLIVPLVEEFRILTKVFPILGVENFDAIDYYKLQCPVFNISITAIVLGEMGINTASQLTEKLLNHLTPSTVILVGIAGAIDRDVKLGDIAFANEINEFLSAAKAVQKSRTYILKYSGNHWKTTFALTRLATNFEFAHKSLYNGWTKNAKSFRKNLDIDATLYHLVNEKPKIHVGHIASGDIVGASEAYTIELQGIDRKFLAIEMEAAGVAQAAHGREKPANIIIIRGISDFADERKHELDATGNRAWRSYAMYNASNFLFNFLKTTNVNISAKPSITTSNAISFSKTQIKQPKNILPPDHPLPFNTSGKLSITEEISSENLDRIVPMATFRHTNIVHSLSISPTGPFVITASENHNVQLWSLINGEPLHSFDHKGGVTSVSYSNDGEVFASAALDQIYIWKSTKASPLRTFIHHNVRIVRFSPDNKILASGGGSMEGTIRLWSIADKAIRQTLYHERPICNLAFSPNGKTIAAASEDTVVKLWRVSDGKLLFILDHNYPVDCLTFSPDGQTVVTGSRDNKIRYWQVNNSSLIYTIKKQGGPILDVAFSPSGQLGVAVSEDHTILFWLILTGHIIKTLNTHQDAVSCVSFSKDGKLLLSGDNSGVVIAWRVK